MTKALENYYPFDDKEWSVYDVMFIARYLHHLHKHILKLNDHITTNGDYLAQQFEKAYIDALKDCNQKAFAQKSLF